MSAKSKSVWGIILKSIVAVATALAGIRSQLLHRPMRTATPIIIHCSATSQGVAPSFEQRWFRLI